MTKPSIIIIGAGAAGLIAARELLPVFNVMLLEAQSIVGGRIQSIQQDKDIIESGAEFIHGNLPVTLGLLKDAGISCEKTEGGMYRKKNGKFSKVEEMTEGWDDLLDKMKTAKENITMQDLLDKYYAAPRHELLRRHVKSYVEGFDLADLNRVSVQALYREWDAEEEDIYRIPGGYTSLIKYIEEQVKNKGCVLHTRIVVKKVEWQPGKVTAYAANGKEYTADKLLVTVPVSVLQTQALISSIQFDPPIHFDKTTSNDIGFGAVIKVIIKFKKAFWQKDAGFILSDEFFPTWWTQLPDEMPILTGWLGGPSASAISDDSEESILSKALLSIAAIYNKSIEELKEEIEWSKVFNWQKNEYAVGAYSYATLQTELAQKLITEPLAGTIFFAGEALYTGPHPGTVEAALVSGMEVAEKIKKVTRD